jgi:hypothetical protein
MAVGFGVGWRKIVIPWLLAGCDDTIVVAGGGMVSMVPSRLESGTTIGAPQFDLGLVANGEETGPVTMATVHGSGTIASSL